MNISDSSMDAMPAPQDPRMDRALGLPIESVQPQAGTSPATSPDLEQNFPDRAEDDQPRDRAQGNPAKADSSENAVLVNLAQNPLLSGLNPVRGLRILRFVGYGLLAVSFIDLLYVIFPAELMNPVWEYQTTGDVVRLIPVPLLAFMLVFYGESAARFRLERPVVKLVSWSTLLIGVLLILLIPLTVVNTMRISRFNNDQINTQVNQQKLLLETTQAQLDQATPAQLQSLIPVPDDKTKQIPNAPKNAEEAKAQVLDNLKKAREEANKQADQARKNVQKNLTKNSSKIILEALVGGALFLYIWYVSGWARKRLGDAYEMAGAGHSAPKLPNNAAPTSRKSARRRRRN
ncbi:HpsJ family protein [Alkalinema pantanalense CENA528]|uniref:HpsJ-like protein, cyanoexosortase A-associated n=1 Tax=Alkalinema pantanalense TaxID=1620705 RepID=UPI003D6FDA9D